MSDAHVIDGREVHLLDALDAISHVQDLLEAVFMMAAGLMERDACDAFQRVATHAQDEIKVVRAALGETDDGEGE